MLFHDEYFELVVVPRVRGAMKTFPVPGSTSVVARRLGVSKATAYRWMRKMGYRFDGDVIHLPRDELSSACAGTQADGEVDK